MHFLEYGTDTGLRAKREKGTESGLRLGGQPTKNPAVEPVFGHHESNLAYSFQHQIVVPRRESVHHTPHPSTSWFRQAGSGARSRIWASPINCPLNVPDGGSVHRTPHPITSSLLCSINPRHFGAFVSEQQGNTVKRAPEGPTGEVGRAMGAAEKPRRSEIKWTSETHHKLFKFPPFTAAEISSSCRPLAERGKKSDIADAGRAPGTRHDACPALSLTANAWTHWGPGLQPAQAYPDFEKRTVEARRAEAQNLHSNLGAEGKHARDIDAPRTPLVTLFQRECLRVEFTASASQIYSKASLKPREAHGSDEQAESLPRSTYTQHALQPKDWRQPEVNTDDGISRSEKERKFAEPEEDRKTAKNPIYTDRQTTAPHGAAK
ncbi:hypothetical protein FB451DRAFT_1174421 [Mycena latifolia]|nr:hypothetical protein FB451DRAFT_1174421 [Mycena latifolia]